MMIGFVPLGPVAFAQAAPSLRTIEMIQSAQDPQPTIEVIAENFPNGKPKLHREVKRDKDGIVNHGLFKRWFENGVIAMEAHYVDGLPDGLLVKRYESGLSQEETEYKLGKKFGRHAEFNDIGGLKRVEHYKNDVLDGAFTVYFREPNKPSLTGAYVDGKEDGEWQALTIAGVATSQGKYKLGRKIGTWITRFDQGATKLEEKFVDGLLDGVTRELDEQGHVLAEAPYKAGKCVGLRVEWYPSGQKKSETPFINGVQEGQCSTWYESGAKQTEGEMSHGKRNGHWTFYNLDGSINSDWSGTYADDKRVGP